MDETPPTDDEAITPTIKGVFCKPRAGVPL